VASSYKVELARKAATPQAARRAASTAAARPSGISFNSAHGARLLVGARVRDLLAPQPHLTHESAAMVLHLKQPPPPPPHSAPTHPAAL
jgi:hypothetical protein